MSRRLRNGWKVGFKQLTKMLNKILVMETKSIKIAKNQFQTEFNVLEVMEKSICY